MLTNNAVMATIAVRNIALAKNFYGETLGLEQNGAEGDTVVSYKCGNTSLLVYQSEFAGTNKATAATWSIADGLEQLVKQLRDKGVAFEHYTMPDLQLAGDIHVAAHMKIAWFKDPDGNILSMVEE